MMLEILCEGLLLIAAALCWVVAYAPANPKLSCTIRPYWRVLTLSAYVLNLAILSIPGRFDGDQDAVLKMPNLFAPAGWAFSIWGVIYVGELAGIIWIFACKDTDCEDAVARSVPAWCAANVAQCLWCTGFRPWAIDQLWVSAVLLGSIAICLFAAQQALLQGFNAKGPASVITRMAVVWPRSLHLGWTTAASIVNVNSFIGQEAFGEEVALCFVVLSVMLAAVVGLGYTASGLPTGALAIAWALKAVSVGTPVGPDEVSLGSHVIEGLRHSEKVTSYLLIAAALSSALSGYVISLVLPDQSAPTQEDLEQELTASNTDLTAAVQG